MHLLLAPSGPKTVNIFSLSYPACGAKTAAKTSPVGSGVALKLELCVRAAPLMDGRVGAVLPGVTVLNSRRAAAAKNNRPR